MKRWVVNTIIFLGGLSIWQVFAQEVQQCELMELHSSAQTATCLNPCITLKASFMPGVLNQTTEYEMQEGTPCPLPPADNGIPTELDEDDVWSQVINIPFPFYYFGREYHSLIIGTNGVVAFDYNLTGQEPGGSCAWPISSSDRLPSTRLFRSTIFGAYHDLDIRFGGTLTYYVSGEAPNRKFVVDYERVAHYGTDCNETYHTTQRVILYETSNVIDIQLIHKPACTHWNGGRAILGIQNRQGTVAYAPANRNGGVWTADNEVWRFVPDGPESNAVVQLDYAWFDQNHNLIGTADSLVVCPTSEQTYYLEVNLHRGANTYLLTDSITVDVDFSHDEVELGPDHQICPGDTVRLDASMPTATGYHWYRNGELIQGADSAVYLATRDGVYRAEVEIGVCRTTDSVTITYRPYPQVDLGPDREICEDDSVLLDATPANATGNETYEWYKDGDPIPNATGPQLEVNQPGTYSVVVSEPSECTITDEVNIEVQAKPLLDLGPDQVKCSYDDATVTANITDGDVYIWQVNGDTLNVNAPEIQLSDPGHYHVVLTMTKNVCTVSDSVDVTILDPLVLNVTPRIYGILDANASGGLPPYLYSLDNEEYQESGHFEELPDGDYHVYVKDSNGCMNDTIVHVINLIFPPYFSPNNDGISDYWRVVNAEHTPQANLYIYDRYGRLIKHMHTSENEYWDGTWNGRPLLSTDYWYVLILPSGRVYKGHFSLLR